MPAEANGLAGGCDSDLGAVSSSANPHQHEESEGRRAVACRWVASSQYGFIRMALGTIAERKYGIASARLSILLGNDQCELIASRQVLAVSIGACPQDKMHLQT